MFIIQGLAFLALMVPIIAGLLTAIAYPIIILAALFEEFI